MREAYFDTVDSSMQALLLREYRQLEITEISRPTVAAAELLVRVRACGICGSDIHGYDGSSGRRIPPLVMGHEAAGSVPEIGAGATGFREGEPCTFYSPAYY